jgi:transcriptional regulator with PAS, ATPase and Fis domain
VEINCASIPSALLEAELFGHEKGAFTDAKERKLGLAEAAEGGTLFLDEIGEVELSLQGKLLKLLEDKTLRRVGSVRERRVNLRIISATNRNLEQMVREGKFRSDLYFRLHIITLRLPPLRERGEDVLLLARHFLALHGRRYGRRNLRLSPEAERLLLVHRWPGNVRELRNVLEQTAMLAQSDVVGPEDLPIHRSAGIEPAPAAESLPVAGAAGEDAEREAVIRALEKNVWNVSRAARLLGLSRDMLRYRIEKYGLARPAE